MFTKMLLTKGELIKSNIRYESGKGL